MGRPPSPFDAHEPTRKLPSQWTAATTPQAAAQSQPANAKFGKFTRTDLLGAGGMGEVWKAWDGQLGRWVALKFLKGGDPDEIARFQREAQTAGRLNHPHIAAIYEVGESQNQHFIAMQFVEGQTLKTLPRSNRKQIVQLIRDAAQALHYAHGLGIIHRDLKPENLMVSRGSKPGELHLFVMDFGLAKVQEGGEQLSAFGVIVGTPSYMSPEQARSGTVDARCDVYSLGVTLYELITDRKLFRGTNVLETLSKVLEEEPKPPRKVDPTIDSDLETIILKCLDKDPERRYSSAQALADELGRYLEGEAILAHPPSTIYRLGKYVHRRKGAFVAGAAGLLVAGIVAGILVPQWMKEAKARREGEENLKFERANAEALKLLGTLWTQVLLAKQGLYKRSENPRRVMEEIKAAVVKVDDYITNHPDQPQGYYVRARGQLYMNRFREAERDLRESIRLNPAFTPGIALLGRVLVERFTQVLVEAGTMAESKESGEGAARPLLREAQECLSKGWEGEASLISKWGIIKTSEDEVTATVVHALQLYFVDRQPSKGQELLVKANEESGSEEYCCWLGGLFDTAQIGAWMDRAIEIMPHCARAYEHRGNGQYHRAEFRAAIADFSKSLEIDPGSWPVYNNRGVCYRELGESEKAIADFTKAFESDVHPVAALFNRARARESMKDFAGAIADFTQSLQIEPRYVNALIGRGGAKMEQGDLDGALRDLTNVIEMKPENGYAYRVRAEVLEFMHDLDGAMRDADRAVQLSPALPVVWMFRASLKVGKKDYAGAISDYTKGIDLDPKMNVAIYNRGNARRMAGDSAGAIDDYSKCIELNPRFPQAYANRGMVFKGQGDLAKARADFNKALDVSRADWSDRAWIEAELKSISE